MTILYEVERKGVKTQMVLKEDDPIIAKALAGTLRNAGFKILAMVESAADTIHFRGSN